MRYWTILLGVAAISAAGGAQEPGSAWGAFNGPGGSAGAGVQAANGAQIILKCDKPGKQEVYLTVFTPTRLGGPAARPIMSTVSARFDSKSPVEDSWRFYEQTVVAIDRKTERSLSRFLTGLADAKTVILRMEPEDRPTVEETFNVTGARAAIAQVYAACKDENPIA